MKVMFMSMDKDKDGKLRARMQAIVDKVNSSREAASTYSTRSMRFGRLCRRFRG